MDGRYCVQQVVDIGEQREDVGRMNGVLVGCFT